MTELYNQNRKNYLDLCEKVWNMDSDAMEYIAKRTSDEWEPVPEFKELIEALKNKAVYEDQRLTMDIDMANADIQSLFEANDSSYRMFKDFFKYFLRSLVNDYNVNIGYKEFIENKVVFKKNVTKIKKVFETICADYPSIYENQTGNSYTKERCAEYIVSRFEKIGATKKSAKKLQFVITFNPMDWFLSSTGEEWGSCFNLNNPSGGYQYCLGLPFLCGDKNRMMLYITDGSTKEFLGIKSHHYQTRTWCILDQSGKFNIVKWYPNDTIGVNPVNSITGYNNFSSRESFSHSKYPIDVLATKKGAVIGVYQDMGKLVEEDNKLWLAGNGKDGQQVFTKNLIDLTRTSSRHSFHFNEMFLRNLGVSQSGYRIPEWKRMGLHVDLMFPALKCSCGSEKGGFVLKNGSYLCQDCYKEKVFVCANCGTEDYIKGEVHEVVTTEGKKIKLCDNCWEQASKRICSCCGKYSTSPLYETDEPGVKICRTCLENGKDNWSKCDSCGKLTKHIKIDYNTYSKTSVKHCNSCSSNEERQEISTFRRYFGVKSIRLSRGNAIE